MKSLDIVLQETPYNSWNREYRRQIYKQTKIQILFFKSCWFTDDLLSTVLQKMKYQKNSVSNIINPFKTLQFTPCWFTWD